MRLTLFLLPLALAVASCGLPDRLGEINSAGDTIVGVGSGGPTDVPPDGIGAIEDKVVLEGARALTIAAITYRGLTQLLSPMVDAGVIHGETAATLQIYNRQVLDALKRGDEAVTTADKARAAAGALRWIDRIKDLVGIETPF